MQIQLASWNVNGLRSLVSETLTQSAEFATLLDSLNADIVCLQETKVSNGELHRVSQLAVVPGWHAFFSCSRTKKGYSGVATFTRPHAVPLDAQEGFSGCYWTNDAPRRNNIFAELHSLGLSAEEIRALDSEGRCVCTDHGAFVLFNIYFPNCSDTEERFRFKMNFHRAIAARANTLVATGRQVIIVGDLNVSRHEIDHCSPLDWEREYQMPFRDHEPRRWFAEFLTEGGGVFVDVFRHFHPDVAGAYTCWHTQTRARESNTGTRIDYVLASKALLSAADTNDRGGGGGGGGRGGAGAETGGGGGGGDGEGGASARTLPVVSACVICPEVRGSDHCPVRAFLSGVPSSLGRPLPALCTSQTRSLAGVQQSISCWLRPANTESQSESAVGPAAKRQRTVEQPSLLSFFSQKPRDNPGGSSSSLNLTPSPNPNLNPNPSPNPNPNLSLNPNRVPSPAPSEGERDTPPPRQTQTLPFGTQPKPQCMCLQPSQLFTVSKKGPNNGRAFFACAQALNVRCKFFMWASSARKR